jgi:hypothetical protein
MTLQQTRLPSRFLLEARTRAGSRLAAELCVISHGTHQPSWRFAIPGFARGQRRVRSAMHDVTGIVLSVDRTGDAHIRALGMALALGGSGPRWAWVRKAHVFNWCSRSQSLGDSTLT